MLANDKPEVNQWIEALDSFCEKASGTREKRAQEIAFIITAIEAMSLHLATVYSLHEIGQQLKEDHSLSLPEVFSIKWQRRGLETFLEKLAEAEWKTAAEW